MIDKIYFTERFLVLLLATWPYGKPIQTTICYQHALSSNAHDTALSIMYLREKTPILQPWETHFQKKKK